MKQKNVFSFVYTAILFCLMLVACNQKSTTDSELKPGTTQKTGNDELTEERLKRFDSLDFQFYSNQQWDSFAISHDSNIKVYYPDGSTTTGLFPQHIDMLTPLFAFAPDTKITRHPVKFGAGDWTAVIGEMEGTFSKPIDLGNGKNNSTEWKKV